MKYYDWGEGAFSLHCMAIHLTIIKKNDMRTRQKFLIITGIIIAIVIWLSGVVTL